MLSVLLIMERMADSMEEIVETLISFFVDKLLYGLIDFVKGGIFKGLKFTYHFVKPIPDPPPFESMMPTLDVFTDLSSVLRVFLPMELISKLLFFTVSFYALRIVYSAVKISFRSGLLKKLVHFVTSIFGGFISGGSDGGDSGSDGGDTDV